MVGSDFGKNLGGGLYEFRVDQDAEQILRKTGRHPKREPDEGKILLRLFFHAHGNRLILLLAGYDKAEHTSKAYQNKEIEAARKVPTRRTAPRLGAPSRLTGPTSIGQGVGTARSRDRFQAAGAMAGTSRRTMPRARRGSTSAR